MYKELIQRLRETSMDFGKADHVGVMLLEAAEAIETLSKPKWISVKKKKPEHGQYVLAILKGSGGYFVLDTHDLYKDGNKTWSKSAVKPLAWVPLPERPPWPWRG